VKIFVFGSNLLGIHGAGAALMAKRYYGAQQGVGEGRTGMAYAIPTKITPHQVRPLIEIAVSIKKFLTYAAAHPELKFFVTRVGCGLAGFRNEQIAPLFFGAPNNCFFDPKWINFGLQSWDDNERA
jgi:hypothetical protein